MSKENKNYKSSVFTSLFQGCSKAKEYLLELYNSLNGTQFDDPKIIEPIIVDDSIYRSIKHDVAFRVGDKVVMLIEHQSTINPNMPLRALMYMGKVYEKIVDTRKRYGKYLVKIPVPEIYVFYNGREDYPDEKTLYLKDAFIENADDSSINVRVKVYNINSKEDGKVEILEKCKILKEYSEFIEVYRRYLELEYEEPAKQAINECLREGILVDYLREAGDEIMSFLTAEYDYDMDIKVNREEAYEEGFNKGEEQGIEQGEERKTIEDIKKLMAKIPCDIEYAFDLLDVLEKDRKKYKDMIG